MRLHEDVTNKQTINGFHRAIQQFQDKHGDTYDYSNAVYVNVKTEIEIICPIHGSFWQSPEVHKRAGCNKCGNIIIGNRLRKAPELFVEEANRVHNHKYDYSKVVYLSTNETAEIVCPIHGPFWQTPGNHLKGQGCNACGILTATKKINSNIARFIASAAKVHGHTYDYSESVYTNARADININCRIHGGFTQNASSHLCGRGCPDCADYGFQPNKPAILYYLSINDGEAYKIGVTNRTIEARFRKDIQHITILHQVHYESGADAYAEEQRILKQFKQYKYIGPDLLKDGNTELFNTDILNLKDK